MVMGPTDLIDRESLRDDVPDFAPGDTVRVHVRVVEGNRERVQAFQGAVIARKGSGVRETFTVRKVSSGVGVERTWPVHSPSIARVEVVTLGDAVSARELVVCALAMFVMWRWSRASSVPTMRPHAAGAAGTTAH